jgi:predicted MFS family arabinose efflux permease
MSVYPTAARSKIRRLAVGRLISATGGAAAYTALNFSVWDRTHSPGMQALSLLLTFGVAGLVGPFGGALGDRFDRRKVMIWCEAASALFFVVMAFVDAPVVLILLAFGSALAELPFFTASRAAIPNLVDSPDDVSWANSLVSTSMYAGIALGPLLGGVLVASVGASSVFALNAVTFFASIALTVTVRGAYQQERDAEAHEEYRGLAAGAAFLWRDRVMRRMTFAWFVFVLGMGMGMVADAALAEHFGAHAIGFAALIACWGTGSVVGSSLGRFLKPATEPVWLVIGSFGIAAAALFVGFAPVFVVVLVALLAMGASDGLTMVAETGIMQRRTPDAVRSRAMAAFEAAVSLGLAVAYLLAAPVLRAVGPQATYRIGGVSALIAALLLLPMLRLRHDEPDPGTTTVGPLEVEDAVRPNEPASMPRYASAEALEAAAPPERRSA